jgi:hypothetical protein
MPEASTGGIQCFDDERKQMSTGTKHRIYTTSFAEID